MAVNLPSEFRKFAKLTEQLHKILCNSKYSLAELESESNDHFTEDQLSALRLSVEDEQAVHDIIHKHPCIIVFGQTCAAKAAIVNALFEKKILPLVEDQPDYSWRMIRFKYGKQTSLSLTLPNSFEVLNDHEAFDTEWTVIPKEEVELRGDLRHDPYVASAIVDIQLNSSLIIGGNQVIVAPHSLPNMDITQVYEKCQDGVLPIVLYGISDELLPYSDLSDLLDLRSCLHDLPVLFIKTKNSNTKFNGAPPKSTVTDTINQGPHLNQNQISTPQQTEPPQRQTSKTGRVYYPKAIRSPIFKQKERKAQTSPRIYAPPQNGLGLSQQLHNIGFLRTTSTLQSRHRNNISNSTSKLLDDLKNVGGIIMFVKNTLQIYLIKSTTAMQNMHMQSMNMFITTAFDMAREIQITPKRIDYARQQEEELYKKLLEIASQKQEEIKHLISETIANMKEGLLLEAECYQFVGIQIPKKGEACQQKDIKRCQQQIQELVVNKVNTAVVEKLIGSVDYLRESFVGTLTRCLENLEQADSERESSASMALRQILNAAYQVEVSARTSSSFIRVIWERMKELGLKTMPWKHPPKVDAEWRKKVALEMISSLSESKLAKSMTSQFRNRLQHSHDAFSASLKQLELRHSGRLEKKEEQRMKVRKVHAPKLARLALDSTSLRDTVLFGVPQLGREIGRGQYGVVYSCESWGGYTPCAVKSVVPPDDKHWNDLALEFHYTRSIPEHDRVVALRGSVIDHNYGGGYSPAVLLLMDRMQRDLHAAIKGNLDFPGRLQVACDVVEGLRYLHSLGLVHRDVKLKNVLLDKYNRGKITDLGFCKPEAMMSGSIVGTPIHMAPELFSGKYDNSVDVYAFGILLWYVCAGHVKLPNAFEQCHNKDHLWSSVKKGVRPEKLNVFDDKSWSLMSACWAGEKDKRPLLGEVQDRLGEIRDHAVKIENKTTKRNDTM